MKTLANGLLVLGSVVAVAWLVEASTVGRGFVSRNLAPVAFGSFLASALLRTGGGRAGSDAAGPG